MSCFLEAPVRCDQSCATQTPARCDPIDEQPASCLVSVLMEWNIPASVGRGIFHSQGWTLKLMGVGVGV